MGTPNWENRTLFHGDNLTFMRAMNSESVDLIATDPPFNKGKDFHATPDSLASGAKFQDRWKWERDVHEDWVDQIADDYPHVLNVIKGSRSSYGDDMGAFLCFMAVRLIAMRRLLKPTGSIYLHCDPTASHYLKELMDAVFGKRQFRNEIVWYYRGAGVPRNDFARRHDIILRYAKRSGLHYFDPDPLRQPYARATQERFSHYIGNVRGKSDYGQQTLNPLGKHPDDVITDIQPIAPSSNDRIGWPTQKPISLYARIVKASSNESDIVLDPFAGCATTLVAAEKLGRQWIGIDIWEEAANVVRDRLGNEAGLFGDVTFTDRPPERTDDGDTAAPFLRVKERVTEPDGPRWSRAKMYEYLLTQHGPRCQGCDRTFDDHRYLELDHNTPRADGGINHVSNRILLCGPCNRLKSNTYTLSGLRRVNKKRGYMNEPQ